MIDQENRKHVLVLWIELAEYYGMNLSDSQLRNYADDCAHYSADVLGKAMKAWRMNPRNGRMPLPGQLLASMGGGASKADAGGIALSLIGAIKRHDYTWQQQLDKRGWKTGSFEGDFKAELGDVAWEVVRLAGGWSMFCGSFWDCGNETAFLAQIRDAIEHALTTKRGQIVALPEPSRTPALSEQFPEAIRGEECAECGNSWWMLKGIVWKCTTCIADRPADPAKRLDELASQVGDPKEGA